MLSLPPRSSHPTPSSSLSPRLPPGAVSQALHHIYTLRASSAVLRTGRTYPFCAVPRRHLLARHASGLDLGLPAISPAMSCNETLDFLGLAEPEASLPPPPSLPGLSLKARESASLSLKRIFDQINELNQKPSSTGASAEPACGGDINVDLQLARGASKEQKSSLSIQGPFMERMVKSPSESSLQAASLQRFEVPRTSAFRPLQQQKIKQQIEGILSNQKGRAVNQGNEAIAWSTTPSWGKNVSLPYQPAQSANPITGQPKAQLTIFYSGTVNVYDDVPANKAHAIMLLAADSGNTNNAVNNVVTSTVFSAGMTMPTSSATPNLVPFSAGMSSTSSAPRDFGGLPFTFTTPPSSPFTSEIKQQFAKRSHTELPFARKASLARFLEKRKDRVQAKAAPKDELDNADDECGVGKEDPCEQPPRPKRLCSSPPTTSAHAERSTPSTPPLTPQRD